MFEYGLFGMGYNKEGFNKHGYDRDGYDKEGFNEFGYDRDGYDKNGYNREGFDTNGYHRDFVIKDKVISKYIGSDTVVLIPNNVTEIGEGAFERCRITSVIIPNSVT